MSKALALILLFCSTLALGSDDSPGMGVNVGSQSNAFAIGNYNQLDWDHKYMGVYRYGGGGGRLQIGQGVGISLSSEGGILAYGIGPEVLGLELMNGTVVANSNRSVESQYTYTPGVSLLTNLGPLMIGPKVGGYLGNLGGQGMTPNLGTQLGAQVFLVLSDTFKADAVYTRVTEQLSLFAGELLFGRLMARYESYRGLRTEANYMILIDVKGR